MGRSDETGNCTKCAHSSEIARAVESGDEKKIESLIKEANKIKKIIR